MIALGKAPHRIAYPHPPAPHDPRDRVEVARTGSWSVLQFGADDSRLDYFAARHMLHLQLWHEGLGVSILTPSALTGGLYEVMLAAHADRGRTPSLGALRAALREALGLEAPPDRQLERWTTWFVDRYVRAASAALRGEVAR